MKPDGTVDVIDASLSAAGRVSNPKISGDWHVDSDCLLCSRCIWTYCTILQGVLFKERIAFVMNLGAFRVTLTFK